MIKSKAVKEAEKYYERALKCIFNIKDPNFSTSLNDFKEYLKKAYDILPSGLDNFSIKGFLKKENKKEFIERNGITTRYNINSKRGHLYDGFIHFSIGKMEDAYNCFNSAIIWNSENDDLPYLLRGSLPADVNPRKLEDITTALILRPSSRALFLYYDYITKSNKSKKNSNNYNLSLIVLNKILESTEDPIAYLYRAEHQVKVKDKENDILKSYSIDKCNIEILKKVESIFNKKKDYLNRLSCLLKLQNGGLYYIYELAKTYFNLKDYENALRYYRHIGVDNLTSELIIADNKGKKIIYPFTDDFYSPKNYDYEDRLENLYSDNSGEDALLSYFICLIYEKNPNFLLSENLNYINLKNLRRLFIDKNGMSYSDEDIQDKVKTGEISEAEVYAGNIIFYGMNHKIGFGAYSGKSILEILKLDPEILLEYILNLVHFSVDWYIFINPKIQSNTNFLSALEINFVKTKILSEYKESHSGWHENKDSYYTDTDSYYDGGGGNEWSDPTNFW